MSERVNFDDINYALHKLTEMQIAGELTPEQAWQERQRILDGAESNWSALAAGQRTQMPDALDETLAAPTPSRWQQVSALLQVAWHRLSWGGLLLLLCLATWLYIFTL